MRDYRNGNRAALDALLDYTYKRFRYLARQVLGGFPAARPELETDDVLNKAVLAIRQKLLAETSRTPGTSKHLFRYAAKVMRNQLRDLLRRLKIQPGAHQDLDRVPGAGPDPADLAVWRELPALTDRLDEPFQTVVDLHIYQDLTFGAIGLELGVSERQVRRYWDQALDELARLMGGGGT